MDNINEIKEAFQRTNEEWEKVIRLISDLNGQKTRFERITENLRDRLPEVLSAYAMGEQTIQDVRAFKKEIRTSEEKASDAELSVKGLEARKETLKGRLRWLAAKKMELEARESLDERMKSVKKEWAGKGPLPTRVESNLMNLGTAAGMMGEVRHFINSFK